LLGLWEVCFSREGFNEARKQYRYSEYDFQAYATVVANASKWIAQKVDSNTQQKLANRAFQASEKVMFDRAKKVRFKVLSRFRIEPSALAHRRGFTPHPRLTFRS
jgi:hypothetical protein